jgi:hypothetical protein
MKPTLVSALVIAAAPLLAAGCGGTARPTVAGVAAGTTASPTENGAVAFARCMRSHGIPNWPDPSADGGFDKAKLRALGVSGTRIRAIQDGPCNRFLPANGFAPQETAQQLRTRRADALSFARCMRSHGVGRFPDPTAQGQLNVEMVQAQGIDVRSPTVLHVVQTCLPASHGALTPAKIREVLANAH